MSRIMSRTPTLLLVVLILTACGGARHRPQPSMAPLVTKASPAPPLITNHFKRDKTGNVNEQSIRTILAAPVYLERGARIGVVPVATGYELDQDIPLTAVTGVLADRMDQSGFFEVVSEVTTDWPGTRSVAGLRELATRYRAEYLLLYRHRFVKQSHINGWGWAWLTVVGGMIVPSTTIETAGVLEATLFDVKSGTLLFTEYERVGDEVDYTVWNTDVKVRKLKQHLLTEASKRLADQVSNQLSDLVAGRPKAEGSVATR